MTKRSFPLATMPEPCPGCSTTIGRETTVTGVYQCTGCFGLVGTCYRGEAEALVGLHEPMLANAAPENLRYFDFTFMGGEGRTHGFYDRNTRRVVQYG